VLARLDEIDGVAESRVDWTGTRFLLTLNARADESEVVARAEETLGDGAQLLDDAATRDILASYRKGEAWMRSGETLRLSRFEAGVLAKRYGNEAAQAIGLDEARTKKLVDLIEAELSRAFERAHAEQGLESVPSEFEAASERILAVSAEFLDAAQRAALADCIERFKNGRGR
jgi:hypothetical protein